MNSRVPPRVSNEDEPISAERVKMILDREIERMLLKHPERRVEFEERYKKLESAIENYANNETMAAFDYLLDQFVALELYDDAALRIRQLGYSHTRERVRMTSLNDSMKFLKPGWRIFKEYNLLNTLGLTALIFVLFYSDVSEFFSSLNGNNSQDDEPGARNFLNSRFVVKPEGDSGKRFKDVQGIDEFRDELEDLVDFIKNKKKYTDVGAYIPKGVLLTGPPGTGKTLLAKAIAGEAGCSFFYKSGSEFEEMYVGVGAKRVKELFAAARNNSPSIIFIDEIDALSTERSSLMNQVSRQTLNQLLTEMDGFKPLENVIVIAATNLPERLDKAILRPGRFDKLINVPYPDAKGRKEILQYYLSKVKYDPQLISIDTIVKSTTGFTGASIKNLVNIAVLNAVKEERPKAIQTDFEFALDRITMGTGRTTMVVSEEDKLMTAYHEGGHTLINILVKSGFPLHKVTILPRGGALGFTAMLPNDDMYFMNKQEIMKQIQVALGGRVAEEIVYGNEDITTGCSSDMDKATDLAYKYLREWGMNSNYLVSTRKDDMSESYNFNIDKEAQNLVKDALDRTRKLLRDNRKNLDILAHTLVTKETMSKDEIHSLLHI